MMTSRIANKITINKTKTKCKKNQLQNQSFFGKIYLELPFLANLWQNKESYKKYPLSVPFCKYGTSIKKPLLNIL